MIVNDNICSTNLAAALKTAALEFKLAGLDTPQLDARLLLQSVMGIDQSALISASEQALTDGQVQQFNEFIKCRLMHRPVHRIIGEKEFWGMRLKISDAVLDPRADTECLVEAVLTHLDQQRGKNAEYRIADIGTGSGAIILALMGELTNAIGVATDISDDALEIARYNAARHGLEARIAFLQGSYLKPLSGRFDVIVSNPPYIPTSDILLLEPEVRDNDPQIALDGGGDGLDAYHALFNESAKLVKPEGRVFFEIGHDQASEIAQLAAQSGWHDVRISKDYGGNDRVFAASH